MAPRLNQPDSSATKLSWASDDESDVEVVAAAGASMAWLNTVPETHDSAADPVPAPEVQQAVAAELPAYRHPGTPPKAASTFLPSRCW